MASTRQQVSPLERLRDMKQERLQARLSTERKARLQRAAELEGKTLSDFVIDSADRHASEVIREHQIIQLSERDSRVFVEALLNPPEPSDRMRALVARYQREVVEG